MQIASSATSTVAAQQARVDLRTMIWYNCLQTKAPPKIFGDIPVKWDYNENEVVTNAGNFFRKYLQQGT